MGNWRKIKKILKRLRRYICSFFTYNNKVGIEITEFLMEDLSHPSLPISFPLTSLKDLRDGSLFTTFHYMFDKGSVPLPDSRNQAYSRNKPKMLVCHDMKGGYQDDKYVQGDGNGKAYSLWHWQCVDIFVYFSHNLVTIPPPCWINAAHTHGVQVLGTFITEWDKGVEICKELLESKDSAKMYANKLVTIAFKLGFDGWLINIENKIASNQIDTLKYFLMELTNLMHQQVPNSLIIWYDAVTVDGELAWQDQLNNKNKAFFDACDGIFINYTWKKNYPEKSASVAGKRATDVYMGVDVFGRNTYGGGGYQSDSALRVALDANVSVALFAPGWVYETNQGPTFEDAQIRFWSSLHNVWPVARNYPVTLPFFTDFSQGFGEAVYIDGNQVSDQPWSNISCQTLQPLLKDSSASGFDVSVRSVDPIYSGGSSLRFKGNLASSEQRITELYSANMRLTNSSLFIEFSILPKTNSQLYLVFRIEASKGIHLFFLGSSNIEEHEMAQGSSLFKHVIKSQNMLINNSSWSLSKFQINVEAGSILTGIYGLSSLKAPNFKEIPENLEVTQAHSARKFLKDSTEPYEVHLGHMRVTCTEPDTGAGVSSFRGDNIKWAVSSTGGKLLSIQLTWELKEGYSHSDGEYSGGYSRYNVYAQQLENIQYVGAAFVRAFYVDELSVGSGVSTVRFLLQTRDFSGSYQRIDEAPMLDVEVP